MNSLLFKKLYIFSNFEKKAKYISFTEGKNILTTEDDIVGNKKGKSTLLKNLYYTMGADCYFEDKWEIQKKISIVEFSINKTSYLIFRQDKLFKIFDMKKKLLFKTIHRKELSQFLEKLFKFTVKLPNRDTNKLEITPPAYFYLLNYIDQDKMNGSSFDSFRNLSQYPGFKVNTLYSHFGILDDRYYKTVKLVEELNDQIKILEEEFDFFNKMLEKIENDLVDDVSFPTNFEVLQQEVDNHKQLYEEIVNSLQSTKNRLIKQRNNNFEVKQEIISLRKIINKKGRERKILNNHTCPKCHSIISDNLELKINTLNDEEDFLFLMNELEKEALKIETDIHKEEKKYKDLLYTLEMYEDTLKFKSKEISNILQHKGLMEVRDKLIIDIGQSQFEINEAQNSLKKQRKILKEYSESKKQINETYQQLMQHDKLHFNLEELDVNKFKKIDYNISAGGSNKPINTIVWYFNLLKVKTKFNSEAIRLPIILDSPTNAELDKESKHTLLKYIFEESDKDSQLIVSTIGFSKSDFEEETFENIIELTNPKYELLNANDYEKHKELCKELVTINDLK
ncbi:coiled-coil domain-containing protein [Listeria seeligeri]|uniref:hypothetical protein n=1 Tax=Listeria seeligeri TaxID=1640 RepID=UPI0018885179|nr:hypothetical protein [Listeria seeligeri]MBF2458343.1 hypothetical protein [Listeria seeligeri]MBF2548753.1 hypothetical protein [Listeria seeligeri]